MLEVKEGWMVDAFPIIQKFRFGQLTSEQAICVIRENSDHCLVGWHIFGSLASSRDSEKNLL